MRALTRERVTLNPHRSLIHTAPQDIPGAVLLDQTGVRPCTVHAVNALDVPDTAFTAPSPFRPGVMILGAGNSDAETAGLPPTFSTGGRVYAGPCVIVAYEMATTATVPLTLDEVFHVLRHVYILTSTGAPDSHTTWLVDLPRETPEGV